MSLAVNECKTKYMLSTCIDARRIYSQIKADNYTFEAPPLPPKMISVWRSNVGSLLPTGVTMVSIGN